MTLRCPAFGKDVAFSYGILEMPLTTLEISALLGCMFSQGFYFLCILQLVLFVSLSFYGWVSGG
jgi:hypothetical protein